MPSRQFVRVRNTENVLLNVRSLPTDLDQSDFQVIYSSRSNCFQEMADEFKCREIHPHFDKSGVFTGVVDLLYNSTSVAERICEQYKNCMMDGLIFFSSQFIFFRKTPGLETC